MPKSIMLASLGGSIKTAGNGKVKGQGVVFSPDGRKDLTGDYFQQDTDFKWRGLEIKPALYHHGMDDTLAGKELGSGWALNDLDAVALWVETQLDMREEYEKAIYGMTDDGKLGLSSGTASHMIIRNPDGKLVRWPIVEISFTPTPAEPRAGVVAVKSLPRMSLLSLLQKEGYLDRDGVANLKRFWPGQHFWKTEPLPIKAFTLPRFQMDTLKEYVKDTIEDTTGVTEEDMQSDNELVNQILEDTDIMGSLMDIVKQEAPTLGDDAATAIVKQLLEELASTDAPEDQSDEDESDESDEKDKDKEDDETLDEMAQDIQDKEEPSTKKRIKTMPPTIEKKTATRPPYNFQPVSTAPVPVKQEEGISSEQKSLHHLKYGTLPSAVKAIATDLYRSEDSYNQLRLTQLKAYNYFMRYGNEAIRMDKDAQRALKTVVLTPGQLKAMAVQGIDVSAVKTEFEQIVDTLGGWLVPEDVRLDLIERLPGATIWRSTADVSTTSSDVMVRVKVSGGGNRYPNGVRVKWVGDKPYKDEAITNATFSVVQTPIHIVKATVPVPHTLLEDSAYPLTDKINQWVSDSFALDEDDQFMTGTGLAKPMGVLPGGTNGNSLTEVTSAGQVVTADSLFDLKHAVARQYRKDCMFIMNDATVKVVEKLKDQLDRYLWESSMKEGVPDTLLGYPAVIHENIPDVALNAYPIIFGNPKGYQIVDRIGMSVTRDDLTEAEQDIVKFMYRRRLGGQVASEWMFAVLKVTA